MVTRDDVSEPWKTIGDEAVNIDHLVNIELEAGSKRPLSPSAEAPEAKRIRSLEQGAGTSAQSGTSRCLAPLPNPTAQKILAERASGVWGAGDIFLTEGFQTRWCRCESVSFFRISFIAVHYIPEQCLPSLQVNPYLLEEEETYEPPEDPDSGNALCLLRTTFR